MEFIEEQRIWLGGFDEGIEIVVNKVYDDITRTMQDQTWDQDFKGTLSIRAGCMQLKQPAFYSSLGALRVLRKGLEECTRSLTGKAVFEQAYETDFTFQVEMLSQGHATITGSYQEQGPSSNQLSFQIKSDQTYLKQAICDLKRFEQTLQDPTQHSVHSDS